MDKVTPAAPCRYHGLLKPGAKYTNVIYNKKSAGHTQKQELPHQQQQPHHHMKVNGGGEAPKTVEPIWDIVSGLAQALNDAKDQLATLMQSRSNSPQKSASGRGNNHNSNNGSCVDSHGGLQALRSGSPRCYSAWRGRGKEQQNGNREEDGHDPYTRNIHRSHARGYCAFGRNSEFKEKMHYSGGRGGGGMHRTFPGSQGIRQQGGTGACGITVIPHGKNYSCKKDRGKQGLHVQAKMKSCNMNVNTIGGQFEANSPVKLHFTAPSKVRCPSPCNRQPAQPPAEVKRYCVGTQYANLLREEAHHLQEKRIREESKILKGHC